VIAAYVSGHGFGHSTRTAEVLRAVRERAPDVPLAVVTSAPPALFHDAVPGGLTVRQVACDVGLVQAGALVIDEAATLAAWRTFDAGQPARVAGEAAWLREAGVRLVLADIPPLGFDAAAAAGVPSVGLGNFSWDWIYRHLSRRAPGLAAAAEACARSYAGAALLLELPFAGDLTAFPRRERIPLVARRPAVPRDEARRRLAVGDAPVVLLSFGGLGLPGFDASALGALAEYRFLASPPVAATARNVRVLGPGELDAAGLRYADLVAAAEVVVTKPGYGIVSDALAARTRIVYTERGDFPEYPILVEGMSRLMPCRYVSNEDLAAGRLGPALAEVLAAPWPPPPDRGGGSRAAARLLALAGVPGAATL
jgi:L-arabinokinase